MHFKNAKGEREPLLDNENCPVEFIDGGLIRNFPIDLFDKKKYIEDNNNLIMDPNFPEYNAKTLGIRFYYDFDAPINLKSNESEDSLTDFINKIITTYSNSEAFLWNKYSE